MSNDLTESEFNTLIRLAKKVLWADPAIRQKIQQHRINIIPANFYSEIPSIDDIHQSFEYREPNEEVYNNDIFDPQAIAGFIDQIANYAKEFEPPTEGDKENPKEFFWKNTAFSFADAMSYYCILRHFKPSRVIEIGSGYSTFVANQALLENQRGKLTLIEPYPMDFLRNLECVDNIVESFVQDIPVNELVDLIETADIWFIDSTHTVKIGSDCLYLYLKIMPKLTKDMIIHTHDVFLPYGLPKNKAIEKHVYWTEQYLLYAYMLDNPRIEVLFGSAYAASKLPEQTAKLMDGKWRGSGGSIWYKLKAPKGT